MNDEAALPGRPAHTDSRRLHCTGGGGLRSWERRWLDQLPADDLTQLVRDLVAVDRAVDRRHKAARAA